jgi:hypothetical protein
MPNSTPVITAVLSLHREGELLRASFRSLLKACRCLSREGVAWELICILDRSDDETRRVVRDEISKLKALGEEIESHEVDKGDLGLSRNEAANIARGQFVGFLDGDDLCSEEWLLRAYRCCAADSRHIAHPAANVYFGRNTGIFVHPNQSEYDVRSLFFHNLWTALSFAARDVYSALPYERNEVNSGLGYEDWNFNCRSIAAGYRHVAVPQTCHLIRVKGPSEGLCEQSADKLCVIKRVPLWNWLATGSHADQLLSRNDEFSRLIAEDPARIQTCDLPQWIRDEVSSQTPPIDLGDSVANISPPSCNQLAPFLSKELLERLGAGVQELHFVACAATVLCSSATKIVVADTLAHGAHSQEQLALGELEKHLHERIVLFVGALIVQTGCSTIHMWDSARAPILIAKLRELIQRCNVDVVWHQMIPGACPPPQVLEEGEFLPAGWRMQSEVNVSGVSASFDIDAPRERSKHRVLFLVDCPRDRNPWASQSVWYRVIGPGEALKAHGHDVLYGLLREPETWRFIVQQGKCDIVIAHRPEMSRHFQELRRLTGELGIPLVYEVDDNIIAPEELRHAEHLQTKTAQELDSIESWARGNASCLAQCDAAIVATPELQVIAERNQRKSYVVANYIPGFYKLSATAPDVLRPDSRYFTIFYGPGSLEHGVYLEKIGAQVLAAMRAIPNARLLLGGGLPLPRSLSGIQDRVVHNPRIAPQFYMRCIANSDLVLAPVFLDSFSRCKSWIKALEAAAMGAAWIGSALPDYERFAAQTKTGAVVKGDTEWSEALLEMHSQIVSGSGRADLAGFDAWMNGHADEYANLLGTIRSEHALIRPVRKIAHDRSLSADEEATHCQLYWSSARGGFSEERSRRSKIDRGAIATYSFDVDEPGVSRLRIDPIDTKDRVEIVEIVVRSLRSGRVVFRADERGGWSRVEIGGAAVESSGLARLSLLASDNDPQIYLPRMRPLDGGLRVSITMQAGQRAQAHDAGAALLVRLSGWLRPKRAVIGR